jgi:aryl-alcohol dehydrogenase-like predicted oxidoreductase
MENRLILGTVQMGLPYGINNAEGKISFGHCIEILNLAFDNGIRYLDTAEAYGNAQTIIGDYHSTHPHKKFDIITKLPHEFEDKLDDKIKGYLIDLSVEKLYALLFHSFQSYKDNISLIPDLNKFKEHGMVKFIGVSVYTNEELKEVIDDSDIDIIQLPFNLFDNINLRGKLLQEAKDSGKIIHTRSCFLQGLFYMAENSDHKIVKALRDKLFLIHQISKKNGFSIAQLALNYCLQQENIDNILIGVDNAGQLYDNIKNAEVFLNGETIKEINEIKISNTNLLNPALWNTV